MSWTDGWTEVRSGLVGLIKVRAHMTVVGKRVDPQRNKTDPHALGLTGHYRVRLSLPRSMGLNCPVREWSVESDETIRLALSLT